MQNTNRDNRLRQLIKKLNQARKKQNQKIDILCNDIIAAQRSFLQKLSSISFAISFYESILGSIELDSLLTTAVEKIQEEIADANIIFCLRFSGDYKLYRFESEKTEESESKRIESCFNSELIENICTSNQVCTIRDMFSLGLQGNPTELGKISAVTIPLEISGLSLGFILLWRPYEITGREIDKISAVTAGLSKAIQSCQLFSHSSN